MQKKIIALAIAAAMTAPAVALADVTVYGKVKMSYDMVDSTAVNGTSTDLSQVSSNKASRIGFKGSEDLGGGLSAVWQIESEVTPDEQVGVLAKRNSFVGLSSKDMGTVVLGNHDTPYKLAVRKLDMFNDTLADNRSLFSGHDARAQNVIAYLTPNLNGFNGAIAYTHDYDSTETNDKADESAISLMGSYTVGGFYGALAYQDVSDDLNPNVTDMDAWILGLSYTTMGFTGNFVYENAENNVAKTDADTWALGLKYAFTNADAVKFQYVDNETGNTDSDQWSIGYDHALSKNTSVFALYTDLETDAAANSMKLRTSGLAAAKETDGFSFGIEHNF